jgi:hypothetical protein
VLLGRQRDRAADRGVGAQHRLHDLLGRLVDDLVVVRLETDADALGHGLFSLVAVRSLEDLGDAAGAHGPTTLTDGEPQPSSIAIGFPNSTVICVLSPGITISVPSGNWIVPVTSVVRK